MRGFGARAVVMMTVLALPVSVGIAQEPPAAGDYKIGVEDVLRIFVWNEPTLSVVVKVRPDGKITVPLLQDVLVLGKSPSEVRGMITERLSRFVRDPNVTVTVEEVNSFRVYFLGEVNNQGVLRLFQPTRLLQALAEVGGLTQFAKNELTVLRDVSGVETRIEINYRRLVAGDPNVKNIYLRPGDVIIAK